jgi:hypothetical protein
MTALPQQLHDRAIGGTVSWIFEGAWKAELGWAGGFTGYGRQASAEATEIWLAMTASTTEHTGFTAAGDLTVLQSLHDAEINGEVTWWKPSEGFTVELAGDQPHHFADWAAAEAWLRAQLVRA